MIQYDTIGLVYTRACPLSCAHCITESSPKVRGRMGLEQASDYLKTISLFSPSVCFTGGEAMLYYRDILELVSQARGLGLKTSLVSGAGWVRGESSTRARIKALAGAGLNHVCISWDQYHEEFSARERPLLLARLALEAGLEVAVRVVAISDAQKEAYHAMFDGLPVYLQAQTPIMLGRAASLPAQHFAFRDEPPDGVCAVILSPTIEADGTVYACCGPSYYASHSSPLRLGNTLEEPLEDILARSRQDPFLEMIHVAGPYGLYKLLKDLPAGEACLKTRPAYSSICDLCLDVTNDPKLVTAVRERIADIDAQRLRVAGRLWMKNKLLPELKKRRTIMKEMEPEA
ncbi:radical SAM/SPASM domain-containing protein [Methylococcus capsulatus]|jgi:MoaA/NifB/PqqE/SkfB family radical SAM enzyme|nr:radical SAM/SPASM domain-containing protein [Methylococcus capsulatus]